MAEGARRPWRVGAPAVAPGAALALAAAVAAAGWAGRDPPTLVLLLVVPVAYACGAHSPTPAAVGAVLVLATALIGPAGIEDVPVVLASLAPAAVGVALRRRRVVVAALDDRARALEEEEWRLGALAARRERLRMAAELHDVVGHHLAVVVLQAGAVRLDGEGDPARLAVIRDAAAAAAAELERMGSALGPGPGDPALRLEAIVAGVRAAGVRVETEGALPADLSPAVAEAAVRIVREALTNAVKHAPGARVRVCLGREGEALRVTVEDGGGDGRAASPGLGGSGIGLAGLAEAAAALGGRLDSGPVPGGWAVRAELPLAAAGRDRVATEEGHPVG